jgi:alpha-beta hydrolase superfamily lysophospholipase
MPAHKEFPLAERDQVVTVHRWDEGDSPRYIVLLAHGYGEHAARYNHVADALVADGAVVYAPDHRGHGLSEGEQALVTDVETLVSDLDAVADVAAAEQGELPVVLIGHSMGGIIATRYVQQHADRLRALVLSGPVIGGNPGFEQLLGMDPIPDVPIDPAALSRDPAVGEAYANDPLVYHGPFKRQTLESLFAAIEAIAAGPKLTLPTLWIHGELDQLAPLEATRPAIETIRGDALLQEHVYAGAQHEIFNETNRDEVIAGVVEFIGRVL